MLYIYFLNSNLLITHYYIYEAEKEKKMNEAQFMISTDYPVVAVISHKPYRVPVGSIYLPLHVGAALHPEVLKDWVQDNTGENISEKNPEYSELTGLYWLWKNVNAPYKGIVHYRRLFSTKNILRRLLLRDRYSTVAQDQEIIKSLQKKDIILPKKRNYIIETIFSHYAHTIYEGDVQLYETRKVIQDLSPEYIPAFDEVMSSRKAHMFNMMIMSQSKIDDYCSWLFPVISELEIRINSKEYDSFNKRYPGRISEMLFDVWLYTKQYDYVEFPVQNMEKINWYFKITSFLKAKLSNKKYNKSF